MPSNAVMFDLFLFLLFAGAGACVWLMVLINHRELFFFDAFLVRQARRIALASVAIGFVWAAKFAAETQWTPWPPCVLITFGVDLYLLISIISAHKRVRMAADLVRWRSACVRTHQRAQVAR